MISSVTSEQPGRNAANVGFAERLLEVIDSGRRTATYKLALLIAVLDLCARHGDADGRPPRAGPAAAGLRRRQATGLSQLLKRELRVPYWAWCTSYVTSPKIIYDASSSRGPT